MTLSEFVQIHESSLQKIADAARALSLDAVLKAKSGHVGLPLGAAEILTLIYFGCMRFLPGNPQWPARDRFVLSAGHGSALQYALLHLAGGDVSLEDLKNFRQLGSRTPGHPEFGHTPGIETTTGPLAQGLAAAVGIALDERLCAARDPELTWRTWVLAGDGCLMEGLSSEAASFAGHMRLSRLVVFYDDNGITIDNPTSRTWSEDVAGKYRAMGWRCLEADGHSFPSLAEAIDTAMASGENPGGNPVLVVCRTRAGKGLRRFEGQPKAHGNPINEQDVVEVKELLGFKDTSPFHVPDSIHALAREVLQGSPRWPAPAECPLPGDEHREIPPGEKPTLPLTFWEENRKPMATRTASGLALAELSRMVPSLVGGSADLAGSTLTTLPDTDFLSPQHFRGRNIAFGVREHAMAAIANGLAVGGRWRPFVSTFLVFSDYMKPALRLAALMGLPIIYIFTHDSFHVGEDGPTHQPVEHATALRAIPNLSVLRPADAWETFAAWEYALARTEGPTALLLTRQDVDYLEHQGAALRTLDAVRKGVATGGYAVKEWQDQSTFRVVIAASGSEVALALAAARILEESEGWGVRVVSVPNAVQFVTDTKELEVLLPTALPLVAIEAGSPWGARELVGREGHVIGISRFGASGKSTQLAEFFGFTPEALVATMRNLLGAKAATSKL